MLYVSVGDEDGPHALPKLLQFQVEEYGKASNRAEISWDVNKSCTISHVYLLDHNNNVFFRYPTNRASYVDRWTTYTFGVGDLKWSLHDFQPTYKSHTKWKLI